MNQNKKAPAAATTGAGANSTTNYESTIHSTIIAQISPQGKSILQHIRTGRENAISRRDLITRTGLADRALRLEIEIMRRAGVVILAGAAGYFLPGNIKEVRSFIQQEEARARSTFKSIQSARQLELEMQQGEQLTMWGAV